MEIEYGGSSGCSGVATPKQPVVVRLPPISLDQRLTPLPHWIQYAELPNFSPFISPRHSAKEWPLSISPSLSNALSVEPNLRMSPTSSLLPFMNSFPESGSRVNGGGGCTGGEGNMGHHRDEEAMEDIRKATTKLEALYKQPEPADPITKQERVARKGQYYSYPLLEEPHNNKCLWQDCNKQFNSLPELVVHLNTMHIHHESRKTFVCKWKGCIRKQEPFKYRYMLLAHMQRHTGEKPHKCDVSVGM